MEIWQLVVLGVIAFIAIEGILEALHHRKQIAALEQKQDSLLSALELSGVVDSNVAAKVMQEWQRINTANRLKQRPR